MASTSKGKRSRWGPETTAIGTTSTNYHPPQDYIRGSFRRRHPTEKVYIPVMEFPEVNFIRQLLGPHRRNLAEMSAKSHAFIVIRGKGFMIEGKGRGGPCGPGRVDTNAYEEPLHCFITAETQEHVDTAKQLVQAVIKNAIATPEHENNRKHQQLRDLTLGNGTFRDDEGTGKATNMTHIMPTSGVVCHKCGRLGHITRDCHNTKNKASQKTPPRRKSNTKLEAKDSLELTEMERDARAK
ncbi:Branchpoint-bridging protein [Daldinia childiae]|uniref:Branchpoint-bridging protein n=1 Tax=Daldinia childiae TaxID=326645 RepID=UPI0014470532|nr:Branchpoint-bridging protein [Daldinia childiae]KAF3068455.1 Branchpoint-bridging protein [Daldinia childiae]